MAGIDWLQSFMHRHRELSLRKPDKTSRGRANTFNAESKLLWRIMRQS